MLDFFLQQMEDAAGEEALVTPEETTTYAQLLTAYHEKLAWLAERSIQPGAVVSFDGEYSQQSISLFLALVANKNIIVPLSRDAQAHHVEFREIAGTEYDISFDGAKLSLKITGRNATHPLYEKLRNLQRPGLVLFSSGSTGKSKGIVHELFSLMEKFLVLRKRQRMLIFLQLDHIGGINSLLYSLANGGTAIVPENRSPDRVCAAIERFQADLLATSPTFLNLLLLSRTHADYDLSSLKVISYGTEPMPQSTLNRFAELLPGTQMQQTYGLSELGILRTKSRGPDSLWVKIGGKEFETKIHENRLWVRSKSSMIGYLNAPDPFDSEGFFDTGDLVECDGDWLKILGRESEIINVGGLKVYPAEVESVLLEISNVEDVIVFGENHPITGKIVAARFKLIAPEPLRDFKARMLSFCKDRLQRYKVPGKIFLTEGSLHNERFKRMRGLHEQ